MSSVEDYMNARMVMRDSKASVLELARVMVDWSVSSVAITDEEKKKKKNNNKKVVLHCFAKAPIIPLPRESTPPKNRVLFYEFIPVSLFP